MIDTRRLRCIIGWLGMALPWMVLILSLIYPDTIPYFQSKVFPDSVSATYFRPTCITPFMITLGSAGILLCTYNGYDIVDDILNTAAGICALGVCLFPCAATVDPYIGTFNLPASISNTIHMVTAIGFFAILAYNSFFQFTKGSDQPTPQKKKRNVIFRICGVGMIVSFLCIIPVMTLGIYGGTWLVEAVALIFFGISWLTKANCYPWLFADRG